jgi:hypothetical protein
MTGFPGSGRGGLVTLEALSPEDIGRRAESENSTISSTHPAHGRYTPISPTRAMQIQSMHRVPWADSPVADLLASSVVKGQE